MADPEKTTAKPRTEDGESNVIPEFTKDESEKQLHNDSASNLSPDDRHHMALPDVRDRVATLSFPDSTALSITNASAASRMPRS
jgi:hypothetical protein